jgi:hypothetical protein
MSSEEKFMLLESKLSTYVQRTESQASLIEDLRFQQEQHAALSASALSPVWHLMHAILSLASRTARSGPAFWLLLPVTAPRAALEYVATAIVEGSPAGEHAYAGARIREKGESSESGHSFTSGETSDESPAMAQARFRSGAPGGTLKRTASGTRGTKSSHTLR